MGRTSTSPIITCIIPVYNAEQHLEECINSVLKQHFQRFQIIIVNDGSTDRSLDIIQRFAVFDKRIMVIDKKNEGVVIARLCELQNVTTDLVCFLDADDWFEPTMFDCLQNYDKKDFPDFVTMGFSSCDMKGKGCATTTYDITLEPIPIGLYTKLDISKKILPHLIENKSLSSPGVIKAIWNKICKTEFILPLAITIPSSIKIGEDLCLTCAMYCHAETIQVIGSSHYHYRQHQSSTTEKYQPNGLEIIRASYAYLYTLFQKQDNSMILFQQLYIFLTHQLDWLLFNNYKNQPLPSKKERLNLLRSTINHPIFRPLQSYRVPVRQKNIRLTIFLGLTNRLTLLDLFLKLCRWARNRGTTNAKSIKNKNPVSHSKS